ncbi:MAG TPA: sigma-70 family RNA polymerase sigma factor [Conexibacter sp.]|jgi:RNA polymerase sigma factor (sigma-70 family)|nr:sigma-70 family RNA polymerase sigma factor [Conexibacter sp.]
MSPRPKLSEDCDLRRSVHDPEAFAQFYDEYASGVLAFIARRTFDVEVARDLTAETFAQAFCSRRRFRGTTDGEAAGWLYAIARHLLSRYVRNGIVERKATERLGIAVPELVEGDYDRVVQLAGLAEMRVIVSEAFERLRPDQREAVRLRVVDEVPYSEIAARLAISEPTARARVSRGLRQIASALDAVPQIREMTA